MVAELGGVASCELLNTRGASLRDVDRVVRSGGLERVRRGWVALPGADRELVAAVRAGGVLGCVSALAHAVMCQPKRDAVASLDSALNRGVVSRSRLEPMLAQLPQVYAGLLQLVDGRAESGLETRRSGIVRA